MATAEQSRKIRADAKKSTFKPWTIKRIFDNRANDPFRDLILVQGAFEGKYGAAAKKATQQRMTEAGFNNVLTAINAFNKPRHDAVEQPKLREAEAAAGVRANLATKGRKLGADAVLANVRSGDKKLRATVSKPKKAAARRAHAARLSGSSATLFKDELGA